MDSRTASALCMIDLAPLIEAGDFRKLGVATDVSDAAMKTIGAERSRSVFLFRLGGELQKLDTADRPEADALSRAVRAIVRRRVEARFLVNRNQVSVVRRTATLNFGVVESQKVIA